MNKLLIIVAMYSQSIMAGWVYSSNDKYNGKTYEFVVEYRDVRSNPEFICDGKNLCWQYETGKTQIHKQNEWFYNTFKYKNTN